MEMTVKMLKVRRNSFLSAAEMFKKQFLSVLEILFPRMQMNLSWGTVFSTCKDSCKPARLCDSRALGKDASILHFPENLAYLEVSPRSPNGHSLISLLNTSMQLEVNLFPVTSATMQFQFSTKPLGYPRCVLHVCHSNSFSVSSTFTLGVLFMELPEYFIGTHTSVLAAELHPEN